MGDKTSRTAGKTNADQGRQNTFRLSGFCQPEMTMSRRMASQHLFKQYLNNDLRSIGNELHIWVWKTLDFFRYRHRGPDQPNGELIGEFSSMAR